MRRAGRIAAAEHEHAGRVVIGNVMVDAAQDRTAGGSAAPAAASARRRCSRAGWCAIGLNSPRISSGRVGLHVPRVLVRRPALLPDEDDVLGLGAAVADAAASRSARSTAGSVRPDRPTAPRRSTSRRVKPWQPRSCFMAAAFASVRDQELAAAFSGEIVSDSWIVL